MSGTLIFRFVYVVLVSLCNNFFRYTILCSNRDQTVIENLFCTVIDCVCHQQNSTELWKAVDKPVPLEELKSVLADSESIECAYAIWQRRDPENGSFRKGKKKRGVDENVLNHETTI